MKLIWQMLIGGVVGFFGVLFFLSINDIDFIKYSDTVVVVLYIISFILLVIGYALNRQIDQLNNRSYEGDEEDEVEVIKYRKFSDYGLLVNSSIVFSLLGLCMTIITMRNITLIVIGMVLIIIGYYLQMFIINLVQKVYPDRNLPDASDPKYAEKLLEASDEGERHVMLHGFYKSYHLLNVLLVFAMVGSTIYSVATENSQVFSIILMSIVLLLTHGRYVLSIRNK